MQDIESIAILNYQQNMLYFQKNHPLLFNRLKALETLLDSGEYVQKYDLEYKDGYFDVIELTSNSYLYNTNSQEYSLQMVEDFSFKKDVNSIETFYNYNYSNETLENLKKMPANVMHATTAELEEYCKTNTTKSKLMRKVNKLIFLGVGLGLHIAETVKKSEADLFLVVESDIELFRLSLFTCNYEKGFAQKQLFFAVAQNETEFHETFSNYYQTAFIYNQYLKFALFSSKNEIYIKKIQTEISIRTENCYSHSGLLNKYSRVLNQINKNYKFLNMQKKKLDFFNDKPILILGAGPSLGANKEWLKANHKKFFIIAPFVTLKVLHTLNIAPEIIVHIDENDEIANRYIELYKENKEYFKNSVFIFNASVPELFFDNFDKDSIYLLEDRTKYKLNQNYIETTSVGESVYAIGLSFTSNDIYLLGLDLAVGDDGATHTKVHATKSSVDTSLANVVESEHDLRKSAIQVRGNFREKVNTIPLFVMSLNMINAKTKEYKSENQNIYNLSDGAYFEDTVALQPQEIKFQNKKSELYGAVSTDDNFEFVGFCKDTTSNEIYNVDVYIDGEKVSTLMADKKIEKVESSFDVQGHAFSYELVEKYFERSHFLEFKISKDGSELVNSGIETINKKDTKFNLELFLHNFFKPLDVNKFKNLYMKDSIGFLAVTENLEDEDFIEYIKELYVRFPEVSFKAFYFDENERKNAIEVFKILNIEYIVPSKIDDVVKNIEFYIANNERTDFDYRILKLIEINSLDVLALRMNLNYKDISLRKWEFMQNKYFNKFFDNIESLGFKISDREVYGDSFYAVFYNHMMQKYTFEINLELDSSMSLSGVYWPIAFGIHNHGYVQTHNEFAKKFAELH